MLVQGDRLTEKIFSSICLVVGIFWEVVNLLTHTFKCPCSRRKTLLETVSEELLPGLNKHISLITILVDHYVWHSINKMNAVIPFMIFYVWQTLLKSLLVPITSPHKHNTHIRPCMIFTCCHLPIWNVSSFVLLNCVILYSKWYIPWVCGGVCVFCACTLYSGGWVTLCLTHDALVGDCILVNTQRLSIHLLLHRASVCIHVHVCVCFV